MHSEHMQHTLMLMSFIPLTICPRKKFQIYSKSNIRNVVDEMRQKKSANLNRERATFVHSTSQDSNFRALLTLQIFFFNRFFCYCYFILVVVVVVFFNSLQPFLTNR